MKTTKNVIWDRDVKFMNSDSAFSFKILTKRRDLIFKGSDAEDLAILQAKALSRFFAGGRYLVYKVNENHFEICFDECIERIGVLDDYIFSASSTSNSGTLSWKEARTFSKYDHTDY